LQIMTRCMNLIVDDSDRRIIHFPLRKIWIFSIAHSEIRQNEKGLFRVIERSSPPDESRFVPPISNGPRPSMGDHR
jgi:hypothetical protein